MKISIGCDELGIDMNMIIDTFSKQGHEFVDAEPRRSSRQLTDHRGIDAAVLGHMTVMPLDEDTQMHYAEKVDAIHTVEEHSTTNDFGMAVAQVLAPKEDAPPVHIMGVAPGAKNTGPYKELLDHYGLTGERTAENIQKFKRGQKHDSQLFENGIRQRRRKLHASVARRAGRQRTRRARRKSDDERDRV